MRPQGRNEITHHRKLLSGPRKPLKDFSAMLAVRCFLP